MNGCDNQRQITPENSPFYGGQCHDADVAAPKILFMQKGLVTGQKDLNAVFLGCPQEFAILEPGPAAVANRDNFVRAEVRSQPVRKVFVEQHPHRVGCPRCA